MHMSVIKSAATERLRNVKEQSMSLATHTATKGTVRRSKGAREITVAEYINGLIELSDKTQAQIAQEAGFQKPNIISMIKQGATKLPVSKVAPMARALNADPVYLFRLVMNEYEPETWNAIEEAILHQPVITDNEYEIIRTIRKAGLADFKLPNTDARKRLIDLIAQVGENQ
jgi:transcriptional regulator with XRE-family HTH domain